jgi:hypothetical protein
MQEAPSAELSRPIRKAEAGAESESTGTARLSFTGDPEDEASVASAVAESAATGGTSPRPEIEGDPPGQIVGVGPGLKALRARRSPDELALVRAVSQRITDYRDAHQFSQRALA